MNESVNRPESPPGITLGDIYYMLFRHKKKILLCFVLGIAGAGYLYVTRPPGYVSEAKLLVRYVRESRSIDTALPSGTVMSPDSRGENILNTETEILTSYDLAMQVADLVGPEKLLAAVGGGSNRFDAAGVVRNRLKVDVPRRSNTLRVSFEHPEAEMAQLVLRQVIDAYRRKHAEVHRALGIADEFLTKQTDELRTRLNQTEEELRKVKSKAGVFLVDESKKAITEQLSRIQQDLLNAEAELSQHRTTLDQLRQIAGAVSTSTNATAPSASTTNAVSEPIEPPLNPETLRHYRSVCARLESYRNRELDLLSQFGDSSSLIKDVRARIAETEKLKNQIETENPGLLASQTRVNQPLPTRLSEPQQPVYDIPGERARVAALEAKITVLKTYMEKLRAEASTLEASESQISQLERQKSLDEANYRYFAASLEQARVDEALGYGKLPNISVVQEASPPARNLKETLKMLGKVLGGGLGAGIGLALLLELFVDQTVRRPAQVQSRLKIPLFLTVPRFGWNGMRMARRALPKPVPPGGDKSVEKEKKAVAIAKQHDPMATYYEALRDRLVLYFQINGLTHRPKLVGVTGCSHGAGATTIAAGLAASLSETGEGNVLLVDMNLINGAAVHPFYRGKLVCGLDDALSQETRTPALVQDNLYVVTAQQGNGQKVGLLPRRFANIVPKLQATDYDYIIFDMPPVSQTSPTSKLAGLLDMTVLILESERSQADAAKRAIALLTESRAKVCGVLNKHKPYVPRRLGEEV